MHRALIYGPPMDFGESGFVATHKTRRQINLGVAIVQRLISEGANVLAVAGHQSALSRLATFSGPGTLETSVADVSDAEQVLGYGSRAPRRFRSRLATIRELSIIRAERWMYFGSALGDLTRTRAGLSYLLDDGASFHNFFKFGVWHRVEAPPERTDVQSLL
jgi:NAD(P)-dependent dehydrogenase (short-subunit alcohol dehydrogenase family)